MLCYESVAREFSGVRRYARCREERAMTRALIRDAEARHCKYIRGNARHAQDTRVRELRMACEMLSLVVC